MPRPTEVAAVSEPAAPLDAVLAGLRQSLRAYLRRRLRDPSEADDLLQDVFVKAVAAERSGRPVGNWTAWLFAATRSALVDHYRARGARVVEEVDESLPAPEEDDEARHRELAACMRPFVLELPPKYRDALLAVDLEGLSMREAAARAGISVTAMKSRASRARALLKARVLACCTVELGDGVVQDFARLPLGRGCGAPC